MVIVLPVGTHTISPRVPEVERAKELKDEKKRRSVLAELCHACFMSMVLRARVPHTIAMMANASAMTSHLDPCKTSVQHGILILVRTRTRPVLL